MWNICISSLRSHAFVINPMCYQAIPQSWETSAAKRTWINLKSKQIRFMSDKMILSLLILPVELVYRILDNLNDLNIVYSMRNICTRINTIVDSYHRYQVNLLFHTDTHWIECEWPKNQWSNSTTSCQCSTKKQRNIFLLCFILLFAHFLRRHLPNCILGSIKSVLKVHNILQMLYRPIHS